MLLLLGVGHGWDFTPPLPAMWARRMRRITAVHPSGARLDLEWTITGGIAHASRWTSSQGAVVEFESIVPPDRDTLLLILLTRPEDAQAEADAVVAKQASKFWSPEPPRLDDRVRDRLLDYPDSHREAAINNLARIEERMRKRHLRDQQRARRLGWHPPTH